MTGLLYIFMRKPRTHALIYRSRLHRLVTVLFLALPFAFFVFFANVTAISSAVLFSDIAISLMRMAIAYVIALVAAWVCAVLFIKAGARS